MNLPPKKNLQNSGQALLLILLSMSVVLIVALSVVSRSVTDISISTKEESSTRAFNAAESGVERVLVTGADISTALGDANFNATVTSVGRAVNEFAYPLGLIGGDSATVWLANRNVTTGAIDCVSPNTCFKNDTIEVCWGNPGTQRDGNAPALEVIYYFDTTVGNYTGTRAQREVYDPFQTRTSSNGFTYASDGACTVATKNYSFRQEIDLNALGNTLPTTAGTSILLKVRLLYNTVSHEFGIIGNGGDFPAQGNLVDSRGTSGDANRRLNVFQSVGDIPAIFDNVVYSEGSLTKN